MLEIEPVSTNERGQSSGYWSRRLRARARQRVKRLQFLRVGPLQRELQLHEERVVVDAVDDVVGALMSTAGEGASRADGVGLPPRASVATERGSPGEESSRSRRRRRTALPPPRRQASAAPLDPLRRLDDRWIVRES
jgi:hypothetical protein